MTTSTTWTRAPAPVVDAVDLVRQRLARLPRIEPLSADMCPGAVDAAVTRVLERLARRPPENGADAHQSETPLSASGLSDPHGGGPL